MFQGKKRSLTQGWAQYYCYCIALFLNTNTIYCNILYHQYNILQYSPPSIQYIAIFSTINTIYCNILHHQYNILVKIYYIVLYCIVLYCIVLYCIVLYCIVLYCIEIYCFKLITNHPHLHVHYLHSQKHFHWQPMQPTKDSIATVSYSETVVPPMSLVVNCNVMDRILAWPWRRVSTSFDVGSRKLVLMYTPLAFSLCRG